MPEMRQETSLHHRLHREVEKHSLCECDKDILRMQIESAIQERKRKHPNTRRGRGKTLVIDTVQIPSAVRKTPVFVKG